MSIQSRNETGQIMPTHGVYRIRDQAGYAEKLALFKSDPGREEVRAELAVILYDMMSAWRAHLFTLRDAPEALLMAPVNKSMAVYLNLLFRIVDTWPKESEERITVDEVLARMDETIEKTKGG